MNEDRIRIVVADDDARLLEMLVGLLHDLGYQVTAAVNGAATAIACCLTDPPDFALLDHRMPGMSGAEAARQLHELLPQLPVVVLTAYDDPGLEQAAHRAGVAAYLVKGCSAMEISHAIDSAVRRPAPEPSA